ncbi:MAG: ABC transporter ATP-binding protein [Clostridiales bacterium]|nr:ABC transporter ATP-binding protein [Clostridiales bacterium]
MIETKNIRKVFGNVEAVENVSLSVPEYSILGFLGPNGAGKTTFIKMLMGLVKPSSGSGTVFGLDIVKDSVKIRERVGYLSQNPKFIDHMTARENILLIARFFNIGNNKDVLNRCNSLLKKVGLEHKANRPVKGFSGGEKQRLGIAIALINSPELLILDEPAAALDPVGREDVLGIIRSLKGNTTVFYSTHILDDVQRVSDSVAILNNGSLATVGPIENIIGGNKGPIYSVTVNKAEDRLIHSLDQFPWITDVWIRENDQRTILKISVQDEKIAEKDLLRHILKDQNTTVLEFNKEKHELEDVFMDIVKGE